MNKQRMVTLLSFFLSYLIFFSIAPASLGAPEIVYDPINNYPIVDNFTGTANISIPIKTPAGRLGVEPGLNFSYSNLDDNGWLGMGWDIPLSSIYRSTKYGVDYDGVDFVHTASNGENKELIFEKSIGSDEYYHEKIITNFTKYQFNPNTGWLVTYKNGMKFFYGSRTQANSTQHHFEWFLDKVLDPNGNFMQLNYMIDHGHIYISKIEYTGNEKNNTSPPYHVNFYYEDRPDTPTSYTGQFEDKVTKRLKTVDIKLNNDQVRAYKLTYLKNSEHSARQSFLNSIEEYGSDAVLDINQTVTGGSSLPAYNFKWGKGGNSSFKVEDSGAPTGYTMSAGPQINGDFNGDGKADIVHLTTKFNKIYTWFSTGNGKFDIHPYTPYSGYPVNKGIWLSGDFNGDGMDDLLRVDEKHVDTWTSNGDGSYKTKPFTPYPSHSFVGSTFYTGDFNGDGLTDLCEVKNNGDSTYIWFSNGNGTWDIKFKPRPYLHYTKTTNPWQTGDFNGDGLTDFIDVVEHSFYSYIWFAKGDGSFEIKKFQPGTGLDYAKSSFAPGDYNGDGLTDLVNFIHFTNDVDVWLSNGDGTFQISKFSPGQPYEMTNGHFISTDFNGDGLSDIVHFIEKYDHIYIWLSTGSGEFEVKTFSPLTGFILQKSQFALGDFNGDTKKDILQFIDKTDQAYTWLTSGDEPLVLTHMERSPKTGYETTFDYATLTDAKGEGLPFNFHIIKKIITKDGHNMPSETSYEYEDGYYNYEDRSFQGFRKTTKINSDDSIEESIYYQGKREDPADNFFLKGRLREITKRETELSPIYEKTIFNWKTFPKSPTNHAFVMQSKVRTDIFDTINVFSEKTYTYDNTNGNLLTTERSGSNAETIFENFSYINKGDWLWCLSEKKINSLSNAIVRNSTLHYDHSGNLIKEEMVNVTGKNAIFQFEYDNLGNLIKEWDANNIRIASDPFTLYTYETTVNTYITIIKNPLGHKAELKWDFRHGKELNIKNANGYTTTYSYDPFGRLKQTDFPDNGKAIIDYYDKSNPRRVSIRRKEDNTEFIEKLLYFDGLGRKIQTVEKGNPDTSGNDRFIITKNHYDNIGRSFYQSGPFYQNTKIYLNWKVGNYPIKDFPYLESKYDKKNRLIKETRPDQDNLHITTEYSYSGFDIMVTDPDNNRKTFKGNHIGQIIQVIEHSDITDTSTHYEYNAAGDLCIIKNALWSPTNDNRKTKTVITYDTLGRKTKMDDPDMGEWTYNYDPNGNLISQIDNKRQMISFSYDKLNRIKKKTYPVGSTTPSVSYTYDDLSISSNSIGRLSKISSNIAQTTYNQYDALGRATKITKSIIGKGAKTTDYTYDILGRLKSIIYPYSTQSNYSKINYSYYPGTNLIKEVRNGNGSLISELKDFTPAGKIGIINYGNNTKNDYRYDPLSQRLQSILSKDAANTTIQHKEYRYTAAGDIESINDSLKHITHSYRYDHLHRLIEETSTGVETFNAMKLDMIYDDSNLNTPLHVPQKVKTQSKDHIYTFDSNGNMVNSWDFADPAKITKRIVTKYTPDNMPETIQYGDKSVSFKYDGEGNRVIKNSPAGESLYYFNNFEILKGKEVGYIFVKDLRIAKIENNKIIYYHKDHLGSSNVLTDTDGNKMESIEYLPFGSSRGTNKISATDYTFTDQEWDGETGLFNYNARFYDPVIGSFISADSIISNLYNPQILNRYAYCANNPLRYIDPSGHVKFDPSADDWDEAITEARTKERFEDWAANGGTDLEEFYNEYVNGVPKMPPTVRLGPYNGYTIEIYKGDMAHEVAHAHVKKGKQLITRVGFNGNPIKNQNLLDAQPRKAVKRALKQIKKYLDKQQKLRNLKKYGTTKPGKVPGRIYRVMSVIGPASTILQALDTYQRAQANGVDVWSQGSADLLGIDVNSLNNGNNLI